MLRTDFAFQLRVENIQKNQQNQLKEHIIFFVKSYDQSL